MGPESPEYLWLQDGVRGTVSKLTLWTVGQRDEISLILQPLSLPVGSFSYEIVEHFPQNYKRNISLIKGIFVSVSFIIKLPLRASL